MRFGQSNNNTHDKLSDGYITNEQATQSIDRSKGDHFIQTN